MRNLFLASALSVVAAAELQAQTNPTWTQPKGYLTTATNHYSSVFGRYRDGRVQMVYGDYRASQHNRVIQGFKLRRSVATNEDNFGRTFADVQIRFSVGDLELVSDRWAANIRGTPTLVFSASVTFPDTTGKPPSNPWGTFAGSNDMSFPFGSGGTASSWIDAGALDTVVDVEFTGGVLANRDTWFPLASIPYIIDGGPPQLPGGNVWNRGYSVAHGSHACPVSGTGHQTSPDLITWLFSDNTLTGARRQRHRWQWYGHDYPPNQLCVGIATFFPATTPFALPGFDSCQELLVDLSQPWLSWFYRTNAAGDYSSPFYTWRFTKPSAGWILYTQGAFAFNGKQYLTQPYSAVIPAPPAQTVNYCATVFHPDKTGVLGYGPYDYQVPLLGLY